MIGPRVEYALVGFLGLLVALVLLVGFVSAQVH